MAPPRVALDADAGVLTVVDEFASGTREMRFAADAATLRALEAIYRGVR